MKIVYGAITAAKKSSMWYFSLTMIVKSVTYWSKPYRISSAVFRSRPSLYLTYTLILGNLSLKSNIEFSFRFLCAVVGCFSIYRSSISLKLWRETLTEEPSGWIEGFFMKDDSPCFSIIPATLIAWRSLDLYSSSSKLSFRSIIPCSWVESTDILFF